MTSAKKTSAVQASAVKATDETRAAERHAGGELPCVLVTGASGLVGSRLVEALEAKGHRVIRLVRRRATGPDERLWDPKEETYDPSLLVGAEAIVHLAGESIAAGRWTEGRKQAILDSRVDTTRRIAEAIRNSPHPAKALLVASAVGYYGDRQDEVLDESSASGEGFLAEVCRRWEAAAEPAKSAQTRVLAMRFGMILDRDGGALARMLGPFSWGLGGRLGSGRQYVSWIHLEDVVAAVMFLLSEDDCQGAYNMVAPNPLRNRQLTAILGKLMGRPTILPAPAFALRLALGEMADELLLASARALPRRLQEAGFVCQLSTFEMAMRDLL